MHKSIFALLGLLIMSSCVSPNNGNEDLETIHIDITDFSSHNDMIERMEVYPLETCEESITDMIEKILHIREEKIYVIQDKKKNLYLFSEDGKFLRSSVSVHGDGPDQYNSLVDFAYNKFKKQIEILSINGTIKAYDIDFNFKGTTCLALGNDYLPCEFLAYDSSQYMVMPTININENLFFLNTNTGECNEAIYGNMIANNTMDYIPFHEFGGSLYYIPRGINYYFHRVDTAQKSLTPIMFLDFGKETIDAADLPGNTAFGEYDSNSKKEKRIKTRRRHVNEGIERMKYLMESDFFLPIIKFFNEDYVYVHCIKRRKPYNYIYNRKTRKHFTQSEDTPIQMKFGIWIDGNVLYTIISPDEIDKYVIKELASEKEFEKLKNVEEEDNVIIVKYYLK